MISYHDPYFPGPITPCVKTGQNLGVYTQGAFKFYRVLHIEGIPASRTTTQNLGALAAATSSNQTEITVSNSPEGGLLHLRFRPVDDIELQVAQVQANRKFSADTVISRVMLHSCSGDPYWSATTVFVLGRNRQIYIIATNPSDYAINQSRIITWGFKYVLDPLTPEQQKVLTYAVGNKLHTLAPDEYTRAKQMMKDGLTATIVPAEGRGP